MKTTGTEFMDLKVMWPAHWTNGGTGVTRNCSPKPTRVYQQIAESVNAFGDQLIWMENDGNELHTHYRDLGKFWEFHMKFHALDEYMI